MVAAPKNQRRLRVPRPEAGAVITISEIMAMYGTPRSTVQSWDRGGEIIRAGTDPSSSAVLFDARSVWEREKTWIPNKDSSAKGRQASNKTNPGVTTPPLVAPSQAAAGGGGVRANVGAVRPAAPNSEYLVPPGRMADQVPPGAPYRLEVGPWVEEYIRTKKQYIKKDVKKKTLEQYNTVFTRFAKKVPVLTLGSIVQTKERIREYVSELTDTRTGEPLTEGGRWTHQKTLVAFHYWLGEKGYPMPRFDKMGLSQPKKGLDIKPYETAMLLKQVRDQSEKMVVYLFAQAGLRLGDLCSIRPELIRETITDPETGREIKLPCPIVEVFGKSTKANEMGYRWVPIPWESYKLLMANLSLYGELTLVTWPKGKAELRSIGGIVRQTSKRAPVNFDEYRNMETPPRTFWIEPNPDGIALVGRMIHDRMVEADVYIPKRRAHGWRHAYPEEFDGHTAEGATVPYREAILGHRNTNKIENRYHHANIFEMCRQAEQFCPRAFMGRKDLALASD